MNTIQERIQTIVNELFKGNVSEFCRMVDVKQSTMNTILGERKSNPSYEVLSLIINANALNIDANWLILGEGEMYKQSFSANRDNIGSGNNIKGDNSGVVGNTGSVGNIGCHSIGIDPEQKIKKIIDGGKVEVELGQPAELISQENESLKVRIRDLEALIKEKDRTIGYLEKIAFGDKIV